MRLLSFTVFLTAAALLWLGWHSYDSYRIIKSMMGEDLRIEELRGRIIHLDEVLTMSARMAASTGDLSWENRYRVYEPELAKALQATGARIVLDGAAHKILGYLPGQTEPHIEEPLPGDPTELANRIAAIQLKLTE